MVNRPFTWKLLLTVVIKFHITFNVNYTLIMHRLIFFVENLDIACSHCPPHFGEWNDMPDVIKCHIPCYLGHWPSSCSSNLKPTVTVICKMLFTKKLSIIVEERWTFIHNCIQSIKLTSFCDNRTLGQNCWSFWRFF